MTAVLHTLENIISNLARLGISFCELAGIIIVILTAIRCFICYFRKDPHIRVNLANGISLALGFKLGGEVLRTVIVRELSELVVLGAIILLRSALTFLLHWEVKNEESKDRIVIPPKAT